MESVYIEAMLARTIGNRQLAITLFKKLFAELPEQLLAIEKAVAQQQFALAEETVHKLHGSFSFCGFLELKVLAANLEKALQVQNQQKVSQCLSLFMKEISRFIVLQKSIFAQLDKV